MKKLLNALIWLFSVIIVIFSLAMTFIEARLLLSLEWIIYDSPLGGFIRYFFRLLISLYALIIGIIEIVTLYKNVNFISNNMLYFELALVIISVFLLVLATNYVGLVAFTLVLLLVTLKGVKYKIGGIYESIND